jgi:transposase
MEVFDKEPQRLDIVWEIEDVFGAITGLQMFCRIRGYISTLRKQGFNVLDSFTSLFSGHPIFLYPA